MNQHNQPSPGEVFAFSTKAETLRRLATRGIRAEFCDQRVVDDEAWRAAPERQLEALLEYFGEVPLVVRSSCANEDTENASNAGAYLSLVGVAAEREALADAVEQVFASYGDSAGQEVLVQRMVEDVALSGVVLTRDLDTGAPYYTVNYDDYSGRTDTVTSGAVNKLVVVHRANTEALHSPRMRAVIAAVQDIEREVASDELDIEFCVTAAGTVYILQARPLAARHQWEGVEDARIDALIDEARERIEARMAPREGLFGATTILGEMPDWNPAEMIGNSPRPLPFSLYRYLITDRTWSLARADMGYRDVPHPLMVDLAGRPYIDVRLSLNSFLPADVDDAFAARLVDYQLSKLAANRDHHDKIEFEVAVTCRDLSFGAARGELLAEGFAAADIDRFGDQLGALTARAIREGAPELRRQLALTEAIAGYRGPASGGESIDFLRGLLDTTISHGTRPFSILARHAFIAVALLKSLAARGVVAPEGPERIISGVRTVASDLVDDMLAVSAGEMAREAFLERYGHLRPGTYDILSARYDENPELYFGSGSGRAKPTLSHIEEYRLDEATRREMARALRDEGLPEDIDWVMDYLLTSIVAREQAKFSFTRGISDALRTLSRWGERHGFSRDDLSYLDIWTLLEARDDHGRLRETIAANRERHAVIRAVRLPHLIVEPDDVDVIFHPGGCPTFITNQSVTAAARHLDEGETGELEGCIVLIQSADPGFDWIFSKNIAGLVTQFGGANSHMAIRCAEFGLPAAIGCGERLFKELRHAGVIELNCAARKATGH